MKEKEVVDPPPPPDNLRCRRTDGKNWRCKNLSADNVRRYCIQHFVSYQAIFNKSPLKSIRKSNVNEKKNKDEEIPSETQTKKTSLVEGGGGGGGGGLGKDLESLGARVSKTSGGGDYDGGILNSSGGDGGLGKKSESLAAGVSNPSGDGGGFLEKVSESLTTRVLAGVLDTGGGGDDGGGVSSSKQTKTKFTQEQKEKMMEFGERLGWRIRMQDEDAWQQFCDETGVERHSLKVWMQNKRISLGGSSLKKASRTVLTQEQKDKMLEFGERLGWRTRKKDKAVVQQFCDQIGVKVQILKVWLCSKRHTLGGSLSKKRSRTTFTQEQKDKMLEFGERLGWRTLKKDEAVMQQFCAEIGVKFQTLKIWMSNQRYSLGNESREGRADSQIKRRKVETQKQCLEADTKRCSVEPKLGETRKHVGELEKVLEVDQTNELSVELEKKKMECIEIQDKYRDGLKEWISCLEDQKFISEREKRAQERITNFRIARLEEDNKVVCDREKRAQERIKYMEEELRKTRDEIEKFQLKTGNRKFECAKRREDDDIEVCEKRFCDLETRVLRMEEESSSLRSMESHVCGHIDSEPRDLQNEVSHNGEGEICEKDRNKTSKVQGKTNAGTKNSHVVHLQTKEKVLNANEKIHASTSAGYGTREGRADFQINKREVENGKRRPEVKTKICGGDSVENMKYLLELEKDLEVYKTKYNEVSVELEKKKKECIAIQDKYEHGLKQWTSCLEDQKVIGARQRSAQERITNLRITSLEEDKKNSCERENRAHKRVTDLEEELRKIGRDEREKYLQLITDNKYLDCARRRAEDETEVWKNRFCELEARVMRMEEENSTLRYMESHACGKREFGQGGLQNEFSHIDEGEMREKEINKLSKLQAKTHGGGTNSFHVAHLQTKEKVLNANEKIRASAFTGYYASPSSINMQCEPSVNDEEKEKNTPSESKVEYSNKVRKEVVLDLEGNSNKRQSVLKLGGFRLACDGGTIEIRDSDNSSKRSWEIEKNLASKKCLKRLCVDQRGEEYGSSCGDFTFTSIHKQKRTSEILTSETEDEYEVKMTKCPQLEREVLKPSSVNLFSETRYVSSRGQHVDLRKKELKWKFEADMLSSFEENPELCLKAVCALYRRQTSEENSMKDFSHYNNKFDALRGTNLAEFLMDGDRKGDLKKSVKELEIFYPKALGECKRLAILYSEQLFNIYHNKEDPFFLLSSAGC